MTKIQNSKHRITGAIATIGDGKQLTVEFASVDSCFGH
jgi:hypothetical protein